MLNFRTIASCLFILFSITYIKSTTLNDTINIKEVTIIENNNSLQLSKTPLNYSEINRSIIDYSNSPNILPILNKNISGLYSSAKGIMGYGISTNSSGTINIHGGGQSNKVLMMVDGVPNWAGIFGHSIADNWASNNVKSIEVIKGPASLYYGSNAMGGAINVITQLQENNGYEIDAKASAGSYATQDYGVTLGYKQNKFAVTASGTYNYSDGLRDNSQFHLWNAFTSMKYLFNKNWNSIVRLDITQFKGENPGMNNNPIYDNWMQALRGTVTVSVNNNYKKYYGTVSGYYSWGAHKINDGYYKGQQPKDYLFHSHDHITGFTAVENAQLWAGSLLTLGVDYQNWGGKSWNEIIATGEKQWDKFLTEQGKSINNEGVFFTAQQKFLKLFTLNAGVRYQHSEQYGNEWIPQAGIIFSNNDNTKLKFCFSKGFRAPNLRELYLYMAANPDLKPESMFNYEVTWEQYLLEKHIKIGVGIYYIDGKNMIETQNIDGKPKNMNVSNFYNKGVDFDFMYYISKNFNIQANYSYLYSNKQLLSAPTNKIYAAFNYNYNKFYATIDNETILGLYVSTSSSSTKRDYSLVNAKFSYNINIKNVKLIPFLDLNNITNTRYSVLEGFQMPRFNFMGGLKISL